MDVQRPDPDKLLARIKAAEPPEKTAGKLKIFFGYAAGVGKTYAMIEAALAQRVAGQDVLAGYVEPHARPETMALLEGLETLPPKEIAYRGITLKEFDLDAALARRPQLILVDELAHSNAQGCRNRKRYQDIEELLRAGISVYTTVNVQHVESLNDIVASITGVTVRERVPDSVFDSADQVELVDIEPEELITRLHQGKIYQEAQAGKALEHFFVPANMTALREIALRRTADRVNRQAEKQQSQGPGQTYHTKEHILICLSSSPSNSKVIRTAARMAEAFRGTFTALFVKMPNYESLDSPDRKRLRDNWRLAEQLGARIVTVHGEDVPTQIAEYAKAGMVSKIVIGRSNNKTGPFARRKTLVDQLAALAPYIDIHIIPDQASPVAAKRVQFRPGFSLRSCGITVGILCLSSLVGLAFWEAGLSGANCITVYILGVLLISLLTGEVLYGGTASVISVFLFNYLFTEPRFTFHFYDPGYPATFLVMFLAALLTSGLASRERKQSRQEAGKAFRTEILLENSQKLQQAEGQNGILAETANQLGKLLHCPVVFYPAHAEGLGIPLVFAEFAAADQAAGGSLSLVTAEEQAVAAWVFKNNKQAGATTDTLPGAACLYLAVSKGDSVFAVAGLALAGGNLEAMERNLVLALLGECALALEKERLNQENTAIAMQMQREKLRANLLRAISHDLRTPLTSIAGNADILMGNGAVLNEDKKQRLYTDIYDDAHWLINLVENLLSVTRIENDGMSIGMRPELLDEVIREALKHLNRRSAEHDIRVEIKDDLLMAKMDSRLIIQVCVNIIDNAIQYTPAGSIITISAFRTKGRDGAFGKMVQVDIADDGEGISDGEKLRLFDMFYTADTQRSDGRRGLGLGLSLCRSIIAAHGGTIKVRDNVPRGTVFSFSLQAEELP